MCVAYWSISSSLQYESSIPVVLDLVSQVRDAVLMSVYLDLGNPMGQDFGMRGI